MNHIVKDTTEVAYLKDVIRGYQHAIANLNWIDGEGFDKEEGNYEKARNNIQAIIKSQCWKATLKLKKKGDGYITKNTLLFQTLGKPN